MPAVITFDDGWFFPAIAAARETPPIVAAGDVLRDGTYYVARQVPLFQYLYRLCNVVRRGRKTLSSR